MTKGQFVGAIAKELSRPMSEVTGKHTPGPWALHIDEVLVLSAGPNRQAIVDCETSSSPNLTQQERKANARLIAAAPDLLEALQAYQRLDEQRMKCEECGESLEQAPEACGVCFPFADAARLKMRAAIAKATGAAK